MTVHERIAEAMKVIADFDFSKSGKVTGGASYNFIPIGQILQAVRKAHAKAGLFLTTGQLEYDKDNGEGIFTQDRWTKARGHCEVSINGADGDSVTFVVPFNVQDNSDKLDNKIVTNIERQAYRLLYAIDEGDATDPETEWHEDVVPIQKPAPKTVPRKDPFFKTAEDLAVERADNARKTTKMQLVGKVREYQEDAVYGAMATAITKDVLEEYKQDRIEGLNTDRLQDLIDRIETMLKEVA